MFANFLQLPVTLDEKIYQLPLNAPKTSDEMFHHRKITAVITSNKYGHILLTCHSELPYGASKPFSKPRFNDINRVKKWYDHLSQFIAILKNKRINIGYIWGIITFSRIVDARIALIIENVT